jgi:hypothetical protein
MGPNAKRAGEISKQRIVPKSFGNFTYDDKRHRSHKQSIVFSPNLVLSKIIGFIKGVLSIGFPDFIGCNSTTNAFTKRVTRFQVN